MSLVSNQNYINQNYINQNYINDDIIQYILHFTCIYCHTCKKKYDVNFYIKLGNFTIVVESVLTMFKNIYLYCSNKLPIQFFAYFSILYLVPFFFSLSFNIGK